MAAKAAAQAAQTVAEGYEQNEDEILRMALGAENVDDLLAMLEDSGVIGQQDDEEAQAVEAAEQEWEAARKSFWERTGGDPMKGKMVANWAMGKAKRLRKEMADAKTFAEAQKKQITEYCDRITRRCESRVTKLEDALSQWHHRTGEKTVELPNGKLTWEKARDVVAWDEQAAVKYAVTAAQQASLAVIEGAGGLEGKTAEEQLALIEQADEASLAVLMSLLTIKKTPIADDLTTDEGGNAYYCDADGQKIVVVAKVSNPNAGVPRQWQEPGSEEEPRPQPWCKSGEVYQQKVKLA